MSNILTINLGAITKDEMLDAVAIANDYSTTLVQLKEMQELCTYADLQNAGTVENFLTNKGITFKQVSNVLLPQNAMPETEATVVYLVEEEIDNPETKIDFALRKITEAFLLKYKETATIAAQKKVEMLINSSTITTE